MPCELLTPKGGSDFIPKSELPMQCLNCIERAIVDPNTETVEQMDDFGDRDVVDVEVLSAGVSVTRGVYRVINGVEDPDTGKTSVYSREFIPLACLQQPQLVLSEK